MNGTASTSLSMGLGIGSGGGDGGLRSPFTAGQWQELEHQAMIYKYLVAGLPVPPDLVMPIRRSFEAISARFFPHPSLGYVSYYGKKFDPEPGRCRRTDGKKWRCSKNAHPDSKYCERHMHRGRNRSRKPVESQTTSQPLPTPPNTISFKSSGNGGSGSFQNMPLNTDGSSHGGSVSKFQIDNLSFAFDNKELGCIPGLALDSEASTNTGTVGFGSTGSSNSSWRLLPSQATPGSMLKTKAEQNTWMPPYINRSSPSISKQEEQSSAHPFFSEWPTSKDSWSIDVDDGSNSNVFSSTQLSISIPRASPDFSLRNAY